MEDPVATEGSQPISSLLPPPLAAAAVIAAGEGAGGGPSAEDAESQRSRKHKKSSRDERDRSKSRDRDRKKSSRRDEDGDEDGAEEANKRDREKERDRDDKKRSRKRRSRSRSRSRSRERSRRDRRSRSRSRSGSRRRRRSSRSRSRRRDRDRDRDRRSSRSRSRSRGGGDRRRRSRSRDRERDRERDKNSGSSSGSARAAAARPASPERSGPTLKEILASKPGMSIAEALQILHNYNAQQQQLVGASLSAMTVAPGIGMPIYPGMVNPPAVPAPLPPGAAPSPFNAAAAAALAAAPGAAATKMQREIYLGNLPPGVSIPQLTDFINVAMRQLGLNTSAPSPAVISAWVSTDGHYAFVELRTIEEANSAMLFLSGFQVGTFVLKVGRPKGNGPSGVTVPIQATPFTAALMGIAPQPPGTPMLGIYPLPPLPSSITQLPNVAGGGVMAMAMPMTSMMGVPGAATSGGAAGLLTAQSNVVMATNLPGVLSDAQIKELLSPFGTLRAFNLIPDVINQGSTATAVFEFEDPAATERAIQGLHGISFGGSVKVALQRVPQAMAAALLQPVASLAATPAPPTSAPPAPGPGSTGSASALLASMPPTAALQLSNMVTVEDLTDDELFAELTEDVADECNKYGAVRSINMPRPRLPLSASGQFDPSDVAAGVGRIFVLFASADAATRARAAIHGRSFNGRKVEAVYFPEDFVTAKVYSLPAGFDPASRSTWTAPPPSAHSPATRLADDSDTEPLD